MEPIIKAYMTEQKAQMEEDILKVCHSYGIDVNKERLMQALTDARKFYDEGYLAGKLDAGPKWISVKDRLPNPNTTVLVIWHRAEKEQRIGFGRWQQHGVWYVSNEGMPKVTHWMQLPEPPEEEKP